MPDATLDVRIADLGWPIVSPLISAISSHWSNHCDLIVDGRMISAMPGGVRERPMESLPANRAVVLALPCTEAQRAKAIAFAREQIGKPYDYLGVFWFPFRPRWNDPRRWFCSELTAAALHHAGILKVPALLHRVSPGDLYRMVSEAAAAQ